MSIQSLVPITDLISYCLISFYYRFVTFRYFGDLCRMLTKIRLHSCAIISQKLAIPFAAFSTCRYFQSFVFQTVYWFGFRTFFCNLTQRFFELCSIWYLVLPYCSCGNEEQTRQKLISMGFKERLVSPAHGRSASPVHGRSASPAHGRSGSPSVRDNKPAPAGASRQQLHLGDVAKAASSSGAQTGKRSPSPSHHDDKKPTRHVTHQTPSSHSQQSQSKSAAKGKGSVSSTPDLKSKRKSRCLYFFYFGKNIISLVFDILI